MARERARRQRRGERAVKLYTIGFTRKSAKRFFGLLRESGVGRVVDVRLNNVSQLAGFAKRDDLAWFLGELGGIGYRHAPELAPTRELLADYRKKRIDWSAYEARFLELMRERRIEERLDPETLAGSCLLCSEHEPHFCHRRLAAEYLDRHWGGVEAVHLE